MKKFNSWYFLIIMMLIYVYFYFTNITIFLSSFDFFIKTIWKIIPIFIFIFILMVLINRYVSNDFIIKHIRGNKIKSWFYIIIAGIISTGPMYMWYPLLKNLKEKGITNAEIAAFLYNRSIKPAYLPLLIFYFGLKYTIILTFVIIFTSLIQAVIIEYILPTKNSRKII